MNTIYAATNAATQAAQKAPGLDTIAVLTFLMALVAFLTLWAGRLLWLKFYDAKKSEKDIKDADQTNDKLRDEVEDLSRRLDRQDKDMEVRDRTIADLRTELNTMGQKLEWHEEVMSKYGAKEGFEHILGTIETLAKSMNGMQETNQQILREIEELRRRPPLYVQDHYGPLGDVRSNEVHIDRVHDMKPDHDIGEES